MNTLVPSLLFEPSKALTSGPIPHGAPASALWVALADEAQMRTLWGGWPHLTIPCTLPSGATSSVQRPLTVPIPPWVTTARVIVWAAGSGTVTLGSLSADVLGDASLTDAQYAAPYDMGTLSLSHVTDDSLPYFRRLLGWAEVDVVTYGLTFLFGRAALAL